MDARSLAQGDPREPHTHQAKDWILASIFDMFECQLSCFRGKYALFLMFLEFRLVGTGGSFKLQPTTRLPPPPFLCVRASERVWPWHILHSLTFAPLNLKGASFCILVFGVKIDLNIQNSLKAQPLAGLCRLAPEGPEPPPHIKRPQPPEPRFP